MSDPAHREREHNGPGGAEDNQVIAVTRRTVLAGAAVATAAAAVATIDTPARAQSADPNSKADMVAFVLLSAALTGIVETKLAPGFRAGPQAAPPAPPPPIDLQKSQPGSDPVDIKSEYFKWVNDRYPAAFESLLQITRENLNAPDRAKAIIDKVQFDDDTKRLDGSKRPPGEVDAKYLARSIVLMWYLGAWYDPNKLRDPNAIAQDFVVISPKAYTQAWALRVAQAHPMGFSEMQFGYWGREPSRIQDFIGGA